VCVRLYDRKIGSNAQQMTAIRHILAGTSRPAPFLVFGPPGTGKTVTIVEAMKQVLINTTQTLTLIETVVRVCDVNLNAITWVTTLLGNFLKPRNVGNLAEVRKKVQKRPTVRER